MNYYLNESWPIKAPIIDSPDELKSEQILKDTLEMINGIPCHCNDGYKSRGLTDPDCPRCGWIDEDIVQKLCDLINTLEA